MEKKTVWIVVGIVGLLGACAVCMLLAAPLLFGGTVANVFEGIITDESAQAAQAGEIFLQAIKVGDYNTGFDMMEASLQSEIGGRAAFEAFFPPAAGFDTWTYETVSVSTTDDRPGYALNGTLNFKDGSRSEFQLVMVKGAEFYKVAGFTFTPID